MDPLRLAEGVGEFLFLEAQGEADWRQWPADALDPASITHDLGTGAAGIVVFLLRLHEAVGDRRYLALAEQGGRGLLRALDALASGDDPRRTSLYRGLAGVGVAFLALHEATGDEVWRAAVDRVVNQLDGWAVPDGAGVHWSPHFDDLLFGDAGTVLFLTFVADRLDHEAAADLARHGARSLGARGELAAHGRRWRFRRDRDFDLPNLTHGSAGAAFVLVTAAEVLADPALLEAGADAFRYVESLAERDGGALRVPYGFGGNWDGRYDFGWGHGIAGDVAAFRRLGDAAGGEVALRARLLEREAVATLAATDFAPSPPAPFSEGGTTLDLRFGRAGVLRALAAVAGPEAVAQRRALVERLAADAAQDDGVVSWPGTAPAFLGGGEVAYTGLLHGAAGIGLALLAVDAAENGRDLAAALPDEPEAWRP